MKKVVIKKNAPAAMITLVLTSDGKFKRVSLTGDVKISVPPGATSPGREEVIPAATQEELRWLFEQGHPYLEEADDEKAQK
jgi:hypothetical protein